MATLASLRILLGLDASGVKTGVQSATRDLQGLQAQARNTNQVLGQIGKGVVAGFGLGAGISAFNLTARAVREFTSFLGDSVTAAREEDLSIARLTTSLQANVTAWDGNIAAVERSISARTASAFSDDELRDSLASLVVATKNVGQAQRDQAIAIDLARFKKESLADATAELVKVEAGSFRSLKSLGITTDANTTSTEALAKVRAAVAGQSAAFLATDAGKAEALKVAVDELSESFGHLATGPLTQATETLTNFLNLLSGVGDRQAEQGFADIGETFATFSATATVQEIEKVRDAEHKLFDDMMHRDWGFAFNVGGTKTKFTELLATIDAATFRAQHFFAEGITDADTGLNAGLTVTAAQLDAVAEAADRAGVPTKTLAEAIQKLRDQAKGKELSDLAKMIYDAEVASQEIQPELRDVSLGLASANQQAAVLNATLGDMPAQQSVKVNVAVSRDELSSLTDALDGLPSQKTVNINVVVNQRDLRGLGSDNTSFDDRGAGRGSVTSVSPKNLFDDTGDAAAQALSDAEAAARKNVQTMRDSLRDAYDKMNDDAKRYFDSVHDMNVKAVQDTHDRANAELDRQRAANQEPVTALTQQRDMILQQRRLAQLQADLANATDPQDKLRAQQALADFTLQSQIDAMQADANTANAKLDAEKARNDAQLQLQIDAERKRHDDQVRAFADDEKVLKAHLDNAAGHWDAYFREIASLATKYGVGKIVGIKPEGKPAATTPAQNDKPTATPPPVSGKVAEGTAVTPPFVTARVVEGTAVPAPNVTVPPPNVTVPPPATVTLPPPIVTVPPPATVTLPKPNVTVPPASTIALPPPNVTMPNVPAMTVPAPSITVQAPNVTINAPNVSVTAAPTPSVTIPPPNVIVPTVPGVTIPPPRVTVPPASGVTVPAPNVSVTDAPPVSVPAPSITVQSPNVTVQAPNVTVQTTPTPSVTVPAPNVTVPTVPPSSVTIPQPNVTVPTVPATSVTVPAPEVSTSTPNVVPPPDTATTSNASDAELVRLAIAAREATDALRRWAIELRPLPPPLAAPDAIGQTIPRRIVTDQSGPVNAAVASAANDMRVEVVIRNIIEMDGSVVYDKIERRQGATRDIVTSGTWSGG